MYTGRTSVLNVIYELQFKFCTSISSSSGVKLIFDSEPVKHLLFFLNSHKHTLTELAQFPPHQRLCRNIRPLARC